MISLKATLKAITTSIKALSVDYIVEQGTSGIWTYRKWNSGIAECWGTKTLTFSITSSWGNAYDGYGLKEGISYPTGLFIENPTLVIGANNSESGFMFKHWSGTNGSSTKTPSIMGARPTSGSFSATVCLRAIGKGK